jgi:3-deoxy-D-manno-octulosonic-acid transferase
MRSLYTAGIKLYGLAIALAAAFNPKARLWIEGRKKVKPHTGLTEISGCIWIHCASLGEFEQGRPVLEELKKRHPHKPILLTFFSPSGYEVRKDYKLADHIAYLPLDTPSRVNEFLNTYVPSIAIFVKYEIWHNLLGALRSRGIPTLLISALFRNIRTGFLS